MQDCIHQQYSLKKDLTRANVWHYMFGTIAAISFVLAVALTNKLPPPPPKTNSFLLRIDGGKINSPFEMVPFFEGTCQFSQGYIDGWVMCHVG